MTGRRLIAALIAAACLGEAALAGALTVTRPIKSNEPILAEDLVLMSADVAGALSNAEAVHGLEARVNLYPGRAIHPGDVGPPAIVNRNQIVRMTFQQGGLVISADARALGRAGLGERVRLMNLASNQIVVGVVGENGKVVVGQ